jgi:hypothetical protein
MKSFLFLILILASGVCCYKNYGQNQPVHTTLSHTDGRTMEVVLLSRKQTQVTFKRQSDGLRLSCGIRDLSIWSKCKVYWHFKVSEVSEVPEVLEVAPQVRVEDLHISGMNEILVDLHEELRLLGYRHAAAETRAQKRTVANDIEAIQLKIKKVELKQAEHQSHLQR